MPLRMTIGKLSPEDLNQLRAIMARKNAYSIHPEAFSAAEIEQHEMRDLRFTCDLLERYEVDATRDWKMGAYSGDLWYED